MWISGAPDILDLNNKINKLLKNKTKYLIETFCDNNIDTIGD